MQYQYNCIVSETSNKQQIQNITIQYKYNRTQNKIKEMYTLYHRYIQKIKQEQIQRYNKKHRAYLIRAGKLNVQQVQSAQYGRSQHNRNANMNRNQPRQRRTQAEVISNQNYSNSNVYTGSTGQLDKRTNNIRQEQTVTNQVQKQTRPRRQRQFNRPTRNQNNQSQRQQQDQIGNNNSNIVQQNRSIVQKRAQNPRQNAPEGKLSQNFVQQAPQQHYSEDRPLKQNKLTPEQIQYINSTKSNQQNVVNNQQSTNNQMIKSNKIENNNKYNIINERPLPKKVVEPAELNEFQEIQLVECSICGRKFKEEALLKHQNVCQKVFQQKRKPFEVKATDQQAQLLKKKSNKTNNSKQQQQQKEAKEAKWKKQSQVFQNMIKRGRGEKVQVIEQDTRIQCPGCHRKFNEKAATKHIQFCTKKKRN